MANITAITTGVQSPTTTGAVTGTLDTSALSGDYTVKLNIQSLAAGKKIVVALEDTASGTPFNDAVQVKTWHFIGALSGATDVVVSVKNYEIPSTRFGATNTKLRFNILSFDSGAAPKVVGWLEQ